MAFSEILDASDRVSTFRKCSRTPFPTPFSREFKENEGNNASVTRSGNSAASPRAYCSRIIDESSFLTMPRCSRRFTSLGLFLSIKFHRVIRHLSLSLFIAAILIPTAARQDRALCVFPSYPSRFSMRTLKEIPKTVRVACAV